MLHSHEIFQHIFASTRSELIITAWMLEFRTIQHLLSHQDYELALLI